MRASEFPSGARLSLLCRSDPPDESGGSYESECRPGGQSPSGARLSLPCRSAATDESVAAYESECRPGGPYGALKIVTRRDRGSATISNWMAVSASAPDFSSRMWDLEVVAADGQTLRRPAGPVRSAADRGPCDGLGRGGQVRVDGGILKLSEAFAGDLWAIHEGNPATARPTDLPCPPVVGAEGSFSTGCGNPRNLVDSTPRRATIRRCPGPRIRG